MKCRIGRASVAAVIAALSAAACGEGSDPEPFPSGDGEVIATEPLAGDAFQRLLGGSLVSPPENEWSVSYISMGEGNLDDATAVRIVNPARGEPVTAVAREGGFDPVAIEAEVGDVIEVFALNGEVVAQRLTVLVPTDQPPVIVRTEPGRRRTGVPLNFLPRVVFSEPLDPRTVTRDNIRLRGASGEVPAVLALLDGGLTLELVPQVLLEPDAEYVLEVGAGLLDLSGSALTTPVSVDFTTATDSEVPELTVVPADLSVEVGGVRDLYFRLGDNPTLYRQLSDTSVAWSSSDPAVAVVTDAGTITAVSEGLAWIRARLGSEADSALVTVFTPAFTGHIRIVPDSVVLLPGQELALGIVFSEQADPSATVVFTTDAPAVVSLGGNTVTALAPGVAHVTATLSTSAVQTADDITVVVLAEQQDPGSVSIIPDSLRLFVGERGYLFAAGDRNGLVWSSLDQTIANVLQTGTVTGFSAGTTRIIARNAAGRADTIDVTVFDPQVASMDLRPDAVTIRVGELMQFGVVVDSASQLYALSQSSWTSLNPGVAEVTGAGLVRAVGPGVAGIIARLSGLADTSLVTVIP